MTSLMMPAATMTTMTNTAPIAVTQPGVGKPDPAKIGFMNNNRQGKTKNTLLEIIVNARVLIRLMLLFYLVVFY